MLQTKKMMLICPVLLVSLSLAGCSFNDSTIRCEYTDTSSGESSLTYIQGDAIYTESKVLDKVIKGLSKDDKMYFWSDLEMTGFVLDLTKIEDSSKDTTLSNKPIQSTKAMITEVKTNGVCTDVKKDTPSFDIPKDKIFTTTSI